MKSFKRSEVTTPKQIWSDNQLSLNFGCQTESRQWHITGSGYLNTESMTLNIDFTSYPVPHSRYWWSVALSWLLVSLARIRTYWDDFPISAVQMRYTAWSIYHFCYRFNHHELWNLVNLRGIKAFCSVQRCLIKIAIRSAHWVVLWMGQEIWAMWTCTITGLGVVTQKSNYLFHIS